MKFRPLPTIVGFALAASLVLPAGNASAQDEPINPLAGLEAGEAVEPDADEVVLTIDGTPITRGDVEEMFMARFAGQLEQMPPEQLAMIQPQIEQMVMNSLISKILLLNAANEDGFDATEEAIDENLGEIAASLPEGADLEQFAADAGVSLERIRDQISEELKIRQVVDKVTAEVDAPDEAEVRQYYDENPEHFMQEESVTACHILISTEGITDAAVLEGKLNEAKELREKLIEEDGENFAELAEAHSDCPSKAQGGELGEFSRGQMVPEFEVAAFSQEVGTIGETVLSPFGYHIIKVIEKKEAKKLDFDEVKEELSEGLHEERKSRKVQTYLEELREKATIERPGEEESAG